MDVILIGAGLVGSQIAADLSGDKNIRLTVLDIKKDRLDELSKYPGIITKYADISDPLTVKKLVAPFDLVVDAVPGFLGYQTFKAVIEAGKDIVDIAFFGEDPFQLDELARQQRLTAVMDCGVAPGMSNMLVGYVNQLLDRTHEILIYVGGLPVIRQLPYEYKAGFSPIDVVEEYVRPARYILNGEMVVRPALSEPELINFPGVGTLEAFNTDGLRTLAKTIKAPNMKEKTLRYPGHIEKIALLRETGFFSKEQLEISGVKIRPLDLTAKLLFPLWQMKPGDEDITVMSVIVEGEKSGKNIRHTYHLFDRYDPKTQVTSMARTTGYTASMVVRLLEAGLFDRQGVLPPEFIGQNSRCFQFVMKGLQARGIHYRETITTL